ncbi:MAG: DUF4199 domain-containing protein [Rikenellaceae bacterium]
MNRDYFNGAAKWGLILGVVLSVSRVYESGVMISGDMMKFVALTFEWIAVLAVYIYVIYRANKQRATEVDPTIGYPFRVALNYSILISAFAGIIVGVVSHIYVVNVIGGYDVYALKSIDSIVAVLNEANVEDNIVEMYNAGLDSIKGIGENPPSIFSTVLSIVANYIISGFAIGLIVGFFTKRAPITIDQNPKSDE